MAPAGTSAEASGKVGPARATELGGNPLFGLAGKPTFEQFWRDGRGFRAADRNFGSHRAGERSWAVGGLLDARVRC